MLKKQIRTHDDREFIDWISQVLEVFVPQELEPPTPRNVLQHLDKAEVTAIMAEKGVAIFLDQVVMDVNNNRVFASLELPEECFEDVLPSFHLVPLFTLAEIMAQVGSVLTLAIDNAAEMAGNKMIALITAVDKIQTFDRLVVQKSRKAFLVPGDKVLFVAEFTDDLICTKKVRVAAYVAGQKIQQADYIYSVMPRELFQKLYSEQPPAVTF